jgi:hypothetical protein
MMVKSLSRKTPDFAGILSYVAQEGKTAGPPLLHNFPPSPEGGFDLASVRAVFEDNATHCPPRRNSVGLYHEILSLAPGDAPHATPEIILDLARRYLAVRAHGALGYGVVHADRENLHIHLVISANLIGQAKKLRLSRAGFQEVKRGLEAYQRERYPELSHSLVYRDEPMPQKSPVANQRAGEGTRRSPGELERAKRHARQGKQASSRKEVLRDLLRNALTVSETPNTFRTRLNGHNLALYYRCGRPYGVVSGNKKYRFSTLGLEHDLQKAVAGWEQAPAFERDYREGLAEGLRQSWRRETGYAADIADVLRTPAFPSPTSPREQQARDEIDAALRAERHARRESSLNGHRRGL